MREFTDLSRRWELTAEGLGRQWGTLPGTLDENGIGFEDRPAEKLYREEGYVENAALAGSTVIATRFTRKYTFEGKAVFSQVWNRELPVGKRYFLMAERARSLKLVLDGEEVTALSGTLSTPYLFEVTGRLHPGSLLELISDNSYEGLPHDNIVYSSAATDETQTNWNGILGEFRVEVRDPVFLEGIRVYPRREEESGLWNLDVKAVLNADGPFEGKLTLEFRELWLTKEYPVSGSAGRTPFETSLQVQVPEELLWDEYRGNLCHLSAGLLWEKVKEEDKGKLTPVPEILNRDELEVTFGIRSFENLQGHLCLNGRRIFLRSEANCAVFPETGHPPMTREEWEMVIQTYRGYGINSLRFHSHCPPEAAFAAADRLGILLQPELSHWNPKDAFSDEKAATYYRKELTEILESYANHPSFVMLTFGNELQATEEGMEVAHDLIGLCHRMDATRLFAFSSNAFYGAKGADLVSDFYTSSGFGDLPMRATYAEMKGYLNRDYPDAKHDYSDTMKAIRREYQKPVFSFEVGQFEILPDFDEIADFHGVTLPENYRLIREKVEKAGLLEDWKRRVEATGELALLSYKEEVEAALRTEDYSGISLLGLQDFPGQGTALVGMLNSHLQSKPYDFARPDRFRTFFAEVVPLVYLDRYTYVAEETLQAKVRLANYGRGDLKGSLRTELLLGDRILLAEDGPEVTCKQGGLTDVSDIYVTLSELNLSKNAALNLRVTFGGYENRYRIFVYTKESQHPVKPEEVYETRIPDERARQMLEEGGIVFYAPEVTKEEYPASVQATFTTDFWSVGTFPTQEGTMGLLLEKDHPLFRDYPTEESSDHQWFLQSSRRAFIPPEGIRSIVTVMDSYAYLRNLGMLMEFSCGRGKVLVSTMELHRLQDRPECRALLRSVYDYLASEDFQPEQEITFEELAGLGKE